ncbi:MAG: haloacid dehalogenase-like hydrolase [Myxococcales bacterium]
MTHVHHPRAGTTALAAVLSALWFAPVARAQPVSSARCRGGAEIVRIGFTTFETATDLGDDRSWYRNLEQYLQDIAEKSTHSASFECPVEFDVHLGNYYQVLAWFRAREIDAAVVSAFVADVLEVEAGAVPVVEFAEHEQPNDRDFEPQVAARVADSWSTTPSQELDAFVCLALRDAAQSLRLPLPTCPANGKLDDYQLNATAHLSASGFVTPILYVRKVADGILADHRMAAPMTAGDRRALLDAFWPKIFSAVAFSFSRGKLQGGGDMAPDPPRAKPRQLFFSYSGKYEDENPPVIAGGERQQPAPGHWRGYGKDQALRIPRDVLVLSQEANQRIHGTGPFTPLAWSSDAIKWGSRGYTGAVSLVPPNDKGPPDARATFARLIRCGFGFGVPSEEYGCQPEPALAAIYDQWFKNGRYDFTIAEVLTLLKQDQENSGQRKLALVLPGGGVKAAYQSRLLDELYLNRKWLANPAPGKGDHQGDVARTEQSALQVDTIAGTSGGAMVGLFAARARTGTLASLWLDGEAVQTSASDIFPRLGMLRFAGLYSVVVILQMALAILFWFGRYRDDRIESYEPAPKRITGLLALVLFAFPMAIRAAISRGDAYEQALAHPLRLAQFASYVPLTEAVLYGASICLVHFAWTCCVPVESTGAEIDSWRSFFARFFADAVAFVKETSSRTKVGRRRILSLLLICGGTALTVSALSLTEWRFHHGIYTGSFLAAVGTLIVAIGATVLAAGGSRNARLEGKGAYLRSIAVVAAVVTLSFGGVAIASAGGAATLLEIAPPFWEWTLFVSSGTIFLLVVLQQALQNTRVGLWMIDSLSYLAKQQAFLGRRMTPLGSLLIIHGVALLLWAVFVTPALYDNANAFSFFRDRLRNDLKGSEEVKFAANLVVTGSSLEPATSGANRMLPGDQYFCFDGATGCPRQLRTPRWHNVSPGGKLDIDRVLGPVFASGSPFPVLPDYRVELGAIFSGRLVDGGFVHNTPLQAAVWTDARQALIVHSSPRENDGEILEDRNRMSSRLAQNAARLLPFMFDQSQGVDRDVASALTIASLAPICDSKEEPFPFMADFRPRVVKRMVHCAEDDILKDRRIGRIDSWGRPRRYRHISAPKPAWSELPTDGWTPGVYKALTANLAALDNRLPALDAAFDIDNTTIQNDFGEALLRQLIIKQRFAKDNPEFWRLFPDEVAVQMRQLLRDSGACTGLDIARASEWPERCRDYFVLFWRQYQDRRKRDARDAYVWAAQLLVGLKPAAVDQFAEAVWDEEETRDVDRVSVKSERYGTITIDAGLRRRRQIAQLIWLLKARGWNVWLVSASSEYPVKVLARKIGIGPGHALGIRTGVSEGTITSEVIQPVPYKEGKVEALKEVQAVGGDGYFGFAAGDSSGDLPMLNEVSRIEIESPAAQAWRPAAAHAARDGARGMVLVVGTTIKDADLKPFRVRQAEFVDDMPVKASRK